LLGGSFAQRAASLTEVAQDLALEVSKEQEAEALDRKVADLRAKSTELARQTAQEAREASSRAATAKAEELFKTITQLEDRASRAEVAAAVLRTKEGAEQMAARGLASVAVAGLTAAHVA